MTVYVVSSFRDYGNGERYFSADGVFANKEDALNYIRNDVEEVRSMYEDLYDMEIQESLNSMKNMTAASISMDIRSCGGSTASQQTSFSVRETPLSAPITLAYRGLSASRLSP